LQFGLQFTVVLIRAGRWPTAPGWCRPAGASQRYCRSARVKATRPARQKTGSPSRSR